MKLGNFEVLGVHQLEKPTPVLAHFGMRSVPVTFFVVDQVDFPILIGVADLRLLNASVDPVSKCLRPETIAPQLFVMPKKCHLAP